MNVPCQAAPVRRTAASAGFQGQGEIQPQSCWCVNPAPDGKSPYYWLCEVGRNLYNTGIECEP